MGILDQARRNAEAGVGSLLETLGVKSVSFVLKKSIAGRGPAPRHIQRF
jgi:hypothetical protein